MGAFISERRVVIRVALADVGPGVVAHHGFDPDVVAHQSACPDVVARDESERGKELTAFKGALVDQARETGDLRRLCIPRPIQRARAFSSAYRERPLEVPGSPTAVHGPEPGWDTHNRHYTLMRAVVRLNWKLSSPL